MSHLVLIILFECKTTKPLLFLTKSHVVLLFISMFLDRRVFRYKNYVGFSLLICGFAFQ